MALKEVIEGLIFFGNAFGNSNNAIGSINQFRSFQSDNPRGRGSGGWINGARTSNKPVNPKP